MNVATRSMKLIFRSLFLFSLLMAAPWSVPAKAQVPQFQQVPLTADLAMRALDATLLLRKKYEGQDFANPDPSSIVGAMKSMGIYKSIQNDLSSFGFSSPEGWSRAATSLALAVSFAKDGQGNNMMAEIQQMQNDPNLTDEMKAQMMQSLGAIMPPQGNMKVAQQLLANPGVAAKLKQMLDE